MKIRCGLLRDKIRDHRQTKRQNKRKAQSEWRKKFAFFPIKVGKHDCRWLEFVETKTYFFKYVVKNFGSWKETDYLFENKPRRSREYVDYQGRYSHSYYYDGYLVKSLTVFRVINNDED